MGKRFDSFQAAAEIFDRSPNPNDVQYVRDKILPYANERLIFDHGLIIGYDRSSQTWEIRDNARGEVERFLRLYVGIAGGKKVGNIKNFVQKHKKIHGRIVWDAMESMDQIEDIAKVASNKLLARPARKPITANISQKKK